MSANLDIELLRTFHAILRFGRFLAEAHRVLKADGRLGLVGLTHGTDLISNALVFAWTTAHRIRPDLVGGCRPVDLVEHIRGPNWQVHHHRVLTNWGIPSEVVIATPRVAEGAAA